MTNKEKFKDICEKLECFDNPLLKKYAKELWNIYSQQLSIDAIIEAVAEEQGIDKDTIMGTSHKQEAVYARYLVTKRAEENNFSQTQVAHALNRDASTIGWYFNNYQPPK